MENKINIAEILKDCPKGMELYSPLCGDCKLYDVNDYTIRIETPNKDTLISLYHDGRYCSNGEIMLFPKGKTTWEGFVPPCKFKEGDVVISNREGIHLLRTENSSYCTYRKYAWRSAYEFDSTITTSVKVIRLATEEEKQKLFDAIKANGYKWNPETKTLEKLIKPEFKIGNKVRHKTNHNVVFTIDGIEEDFYTCAGKMALCFSEQDSYELVPNKFDISTLVPFESKVLVRDNTDEVWFPCFFGGICTNDNSNYPYRIVGGERWKCCIPYEGNEHLLNKKDDCDTFYKNW